MRAALIGGGTGGHLFPCVAVAEQLMGDHDACILLIGAEGRMDEQVLPALDIPYRLIPALPFPYRPSLGAVRAAWAMLRSIWCCMHILRQFDPDVVFASGGFVSVPGVLAAKLLRLPTLCHASDAFVGRADRLLARWADRVTVNYEVAAQTLAAAEPTVVGQPVREGFLRTDREQARQELGIPPNAFVILVVGGSQGARSINRAVVGAAGELLEDPNTHLIHLIGSRDYADTVRQLREMAIDMRRYHCYDFHDEPWVVIAAADLCVTRGGANSLAEISLMGVPMIIVPYPHAAAHQKMNAQPLLDAGAAIAINDEELSPQTLLDHIEHLGSDPAVLRKMATGARDAARPEAAAETARMIADVAGTDTHKPA